MQTEYCSLVIMTMFFLVAWLPSSIGKMRSFGTKWLAGNRSPVYGKELEPWAARCERAHNNLKDNLPGFIVAIFALGLLQKFDSGTAMAAMIYVGGRFGHYIAYGIGNPLLRGLFYFTGLFSNFYLLIKVL